jgi:hypothetical protein
MGDTYKEPPIDKQSTRVIVETIVGNANKDLQVGSWIITRARVISGNYNRLFILGEHLKALGIEGIDKDLAVIAGATIGFSPQIPDFGMRGEAVAIITQQNLPKSEKVREGGTGILKRAEPPAATEE